MIDFRYHVVSIIAVFLALGTGIVLGSTALDRPIIDDLKRRTSGLAEDKAALQDRVNRLEDASDDDAAVVAGLGDFVTAGRLTGQRVTVLSTPGAGIDVRDSVVAGIRDAGGRVSSQIRLLPRLLDPSAAAEIDDLVTSLASGVQVPSGLVARAATELAVALDADDLPDGAQPPAQTTRLVSGFREAGLIAVDGSAAVRPGDLVVIVVGATSTARDASAVPSPGPAVDPVVDVLAAFASRSAVVVAGAADAVEPGAILRTLRENAALAARLSSVDTAGTPAGTIATVLALADAARREFGHYGIGTGAEAPLPAPEPAPAPA